MRAAWASRGRKARSTWWTQHLAAVLVRLGRDFGDLPVAEIVETATRTMSAMPTADPEDVEPLLRDRLQELRSHLTPASTVPEPDAGDWDPAFGDPDRQLEAGLAADLVAAAIATDGRRLTVQEIDDALGVRDAGRAGQ